MNLNERHRKKYLSSINTFLLFSLMCNIVCYCHCTLYRNYTNEWAVKISGGKSVAVKIAHKYGFSFKGEIMPDYYRFIHRNVRKRSTEDSSHVHSDLSSDPQVEWIEQQVIINRKKRRINGRNFLRFNDPKWPQMWYLNRAPDNGMKVLNAWAQGYTGKGVVVTILDDGIEFDHPDLKNNYDEYASYDVNGDDNIPKPRYDDSDENKHGTRCAGEVAAQANNNVCNVGVAFNARIGGVRMLDGDITDTVEATSLSLRPQHIHIYSASWGPDDDGRTVDGPATLARKAFYDGVTKGRGGLGSIFVWASGNGGSKKDNCNCDGYTNSIYTLSISSATETGHIPWYSEACSSTLATTYSSGSVVEKQIVTTDLHNGCTDSHTGTSASAPLAAGLVALALEANPALTWRDMQHIVMATAKPSGLKAADWVTNGLGRNVSHSFGFGLMDADAMVRLARNWTTVAEQHICEVKSRVKNRVIKKHSKISVSLFVDGCQGSRNYVRYLEHVEAKITLMSTKRGEIQIFLTSPMGTRSTLLAKRVHDSSSDGFNNWSFMTTHNWGEFAEGTWKLEIENGDSLAELKTWSVVVMGTSHLPLSGNIIVGRHFQFNSAQRLSVYCQGTVASEICLECLNGYSLLDGNCVSHCPKGYYRDVSRVANSSFFHSYFKIKFIIQSHLVCRPCVLHCESCIIVEHPRCSNCEPGYTLLKDTGTCEYEGYLWFSRHKAVIMVLSIMFIVLILLLCILLSVKRGFLQMLRADRRNFVKRPCCDDWNVAGNKFDIDELVSSCSENEDEV